MNIQPGISVLVCCFNSALRLQETLMHISKQQVDSYIRWEVIIIDNASIDATLELATKWKSRFNGDCKLLQQPLQGKSNAIALGVHNANYEYIVICDDDNHLADNYLQTAKLLMDSNPNVGIIGGLCKAKFQSTPPAWIHKYIKGYGITQEVGRFKIVQSVIGAGMIIRAEILHKAYRIGFEPLLSAQRGSKIKSGEDTEHCMLAAMMGYNFAQSDLLQLEHLIPDNKLKWSYCLKLNASFGHSNTILSIYERVLENKGRYPLFYCFNKIRYLLYTQLKYQLLYTRDIQEIGNEKAITYASVKVQLKTYFELSFKLNKLYLTITNLNKLMTI